MDPFSALGLAANLVQFLELGWTLVTNAREITTTGTTKRNERLEDTCKNFEVILQNIKSSSDVLHTSKRQLTLEESALQKLAIKCGETSSELESILENLKVDHNSSTRTRGFRKSFRTLWESPKIKELELRLSEYRHELVANLCALMSNRQSRVLRELATLQEHNESMHLRQTTKLDQISRTLQQINQVSGRLHENALSPITQKLDQVISGVNKIAEEDERPLKEYAIPLEEVRSSLKIMKDQTHKALSADAWNDLVKRMLVLVEIGGDLLSEDAKKQSLLREKYGLLTEQELRKIYFEGLSKETASYPSLKLEKQEELDKVKVEINSVTGKLLKTMEPSMIKKATQVKKERLRYEMQQDRSPKIEDRQSQHSENSSTKEDDKSGETTSPNQPKVESNHRTCGQCGEHRSYTTSEETMLHTLALLELSKAELDSLLHAMNGKIDLEKETAEKIRDQKKAIESKTKEAETCCQNFSKALPEKLERLRGLKDIKETLLQLRRTEFSGLADTLHDSLSAMNDLSREQTILQSLHFESLPMRRLAIVNAKYETFQWLFEPADLHSNNEDCEEEGFAAFVQWLRHGNGVFWISGKPGSGKSTLMKFLSKHPQTTKILSAWASPENEPPNDLITAQHYFYHAGTDLQKSCEGLLRALLFEIFLKQPALMATTIPKRWEKAAQKRTRPFDNFPPWSMPELLQSIRCLADSSERATRFCFFVDGLDEYEGNPEEVIKVLSKLASSPNVKMCISSRPWNVFEDAYGHQEAAKIYLQNLTRRDISIYTTRRLEEHPKWKDFAQQNRGHADLICAITSRAQGVFLWVSLVVRSVYAGLSDGNSPKTLKRRIEAFPRDLEGFFRHMLNSIDSFYHREMAQCFQTAMHSDEPLPLLLYELLGQAVADPHFALERKISPMGPYEMFERHDDMVRQLNSWCQGLLEVQRDKSGIFYLGHRVVFLHRTVSDFFKTNEMEEFLHQRITSFGVNLTILQAYIALLKSIPLIKGDRRDEIALHAGAREALRYAVLTEMESGQAHPDMVNELRDTIEEIAPSYNFTIPWNCFLEASIQFGLFHYLSQRRECHPSEKGILDGSLLRRSLSRSVQPESSITHQLKDVVSLFLQRQKAGNPRLLESADPKTSIWELWMVLVGTTMNENGTNSGWAARQKHILHLLLDFGVNMKIKEEGDAGFGHFINALITLSEQEPDRNITEKWMGMLLSMVLAGASFDSGFKGTTVGANFFQKLDAICNPNWKVVPEARLRFLARMAHLIIEHGRIPAKIVSGDKLDRLFPPKLSKPIFETYYSKPVGVQSNSLLQSLTSWGTWTRSLETIDRC